MNEGKPRAGAEDGLARARRLTEAIRAALPNVPAATRHLIDAWHILALRQHEEEARGPLLELTKIVMCAWVPAAVDFSRAVDGATWTRALVGEAIEIATAFGRWYVEAVAAGWLEPAPGADLQSMRATVEALPRILGVHAPPPGSSAS